MTDINYTSIAHLVEPQPQLQVRPGYSGAEKIEIPAHGPKEKHKIHEIVEHKAPLEVKDYVEVRKDTIEVPPDLKKIGVVSTGTTQFPAYQSIVLPMSDEKVEAGLHAPITSSIRWFAELCLFILKQAHLTLKKIHGKIIRIGYKN